VRAPDYCEPIVGWRVWLIARECGQVRLGSVMYPTLWTPRREQIAVCRPAEPRARGGRERLSSLPRREAHRSPHLRCGCGIYAAKTVDQAASYFDGALPTGDEPVRVIGRVSLWGRVIEGEHGYRASHAYPLELYVPALDADGLTAAEIALGLTDYRVSVELLDGRSKARVAEALAAPLAA
jgi:hypothetical protein